MSPEALTRRFVAPVLFAIACAREPQVPPLPFEYVTFEACDPVDRRAFDSHRGERVFVSDNEARAIVRVEFARLEASLSFDEYVVPAVREYDLFDSVGHVYKRRERGPLVLDGWDARLALGYEFLDAGEIGALGGLPCPSEHGWAAPETAQALEAQLKGIVPGMVGVFYDPGERAHGDPRKAFPRAHAAIRTQVRRFVDRAIAERVLP